MISAMFLHLQFLESPTGGKKIPNIQKEWSSPSPLLFKAQIFKHEHMYGNYLVSMLYKSEKVPINPL